VRILVAGYGTVGKAFTQILLSRSGYLQSRWSVKLELVGVVRKDLKKGREGIPKEIPLFGTFEEGLKETRPDVVVELTGTVEEAREYILKALQSGADCITANKAVIARYGREIRAVAHERRQVFLAEASVGGVVPIMRTLHTSFAGDRIRRILGVWNGTCNYILTRMEEEGESFSDALRSATEKGYAEPDPSLDIRGEDSANKALVLAQLAFDLDLPKESLSYRGIEELRSEDFSIVGDLGFRSRMVGWLERKEEGIQIYVGPALLPKDHPVASVTGVTNGIYVEGEVSGGVFLSGLGAGPGPTSIALLGDLLEIARIRRETRKLNAYWGSLKNRLGEESFIPYREMVLPCYIRFHVLDRPGTLAKIAGVLGDLGISIESVIQPIRHAVDAVPIHMTTHPAPLGLIERALEIIYPPHLFTVARSQLPLSLSPSDLPPFYGEGVPTSPPFWMPILR